jgi:hypothetical protein
MVIMSVLCSLEIISVFFAFHVTQCVMHVTLKTLSARCKYFSFPNPYLRIRMFRILLYVLGLVTAVSIQSGPSHPSPNNRQLIPSIFKVRQLHLEDYILILNKIFVVVSQLQYTS